jgi:hypothetical protein
MREMRKLIYIFSAVALGFCCGIKQDKIDKVMENGVEVIHNHLKPYKIKDELSNFDLEKEFSIDLSKDEIANQGLGDIFAIDVDSEGSIYILNGKPLEYFIFKFDQDGKFLMSFARNGQGPGETEGGMYLGIDSRDNIIITDMSGLKSLIFNKNGELIEEIHFPDRKFAWYPLENGSYFAYWRNYTTPDADYFDDFFDLYNSKFEKIKILDTRKWLTPRKNGIRANRIVPVFTWRKSGEHIFIGNEDRGYDIWMFDLEGNLLRKIEKEFISVEVKIPEEKKKEFSERWGPEVKVWFSEYWPPFSSFFPDDEGRLFIQTFEQGANPKEYLYDIFSPEGVFIGTKSLNILPSDAYGVYAVSKKHRLYCVQEKEGGYKELIVYKMIWK